MNWRLSYPDGGPLVQRLEKEFKSVTGLHGVAVTNATIGLELALRYLIHVHDDWTPANTTVLVPGNGMAADGLAVENVGCRGAFVPVDYEGAMDVGALEIALDTMPDIDVVLVVHIGRVHPRMDTIASLCRSHEVALVEDCAHVMGDSAAGQYGDLSVFSMFATKVIPAGEGGVIGTRDESKLPMLRKMRMLGRDDEWADCEYPGTNAKMSELNAAFGVAALECSGYLVRRRMLACAMYRSAGFEGWYGTPGYKFVLPNATPMQVGLLSEKGCLTGQIFKTPLDLQPRFASWDKVKMPFRAGHHFCATHACLKTDVDVEEAGRICEVGKEVLCTT